VTETNPLQRTAAFPDIQAPQGIERWSTAISPYQHPIDEKPENYLGKDAHWLDKV
jgi:hypothetical protein